MDTDELLKGFFKCGASAALIVDGSGQILNQYYGEGEPVEGLQEALSRVMGVVGRAFAGFDKGSLERQQILFESYQLHVENLDGEHSLILVLGTNANSGLIRMEMRKAKQVWEKKMTAK